MKNILGKIQKDDFLKALFSIFILFFIFNIVLNPSKYIAEGLNGLSAWTFSVLPSVLPFIFFTKALSALGQVEKVVRPFAPFSKKLFGTPPISFCTFLMAILSGYPVGSKMISDLYASGKITKVEATRMSAFCSTSGPMFIIGAVGVNMFKSAQIGYILFLSHVFSAFLNGIIFRRYGEKRKAKSEKNRILKQKSLNLTNNGKLEKNVSIKHSKIPYKNVKKMAKIVDKKYEKCANNFEVKSHYFIIKNFSFNKKHEKIGEKSEKNANFSQKSGFFKENSSFDIGSIVLSSTTAILSVGTIITIFFIIIECFSPIFSLLPTSLSAFLKGVIEITNGCLSLSNLKNLKLATCLASFVISFGGISTILQSLTMLQSAKIDVKIFILQKLMHATLSALITILILLIFF